MGAGGPEAEGKMDAGDPEADGKRKLRLLQMADTRS